MMQFGACPTSSAVGEIVLRDCRLTKGTNANWGTQNWIQVCDDKILLVSVYSTLKRNLELNQVVLLVACSGKEILTLILTT